MGSDNGVSTTAEPTYPTDRSKSAGFNYTDGRELKVTIPRVTMSQAGLECVCPWPLPADSKRALNTSF